MPSFAKVSHISFSVTDAEKSADWWHEMLGFERFDRAEGKGWFGVLLIHPSSATVIEFQQHQANPGLRFDPTRTGLDHLGFMVRGRDELEDWQTHFAERGVTFTPIVDRNYGSVLTFKDPDGMQAEMFFREGHP